jgi:hypothetical protein
MNADIVFYDHGWIVILEPVSDKGRAWLGPDDLVCDRNRFWDRFADMLDEGLEVESYWEWQRDT